MRDPRVVLVTGGSGFLGQHIIKHLHQSSLFTKIRTFDIKEYQQMLDFVPMKAVEVLKGDLTNYENVEEAVKGVHTVIHTAGFVDVSMFQDAEKLHRINVIGTKNVISACIKCNVESLVYTSTMDVVIGSKDIHDGDETLVPPKDPLWDDYAKTKLIAEQSVCSAEGTALPNSSVLKTAVIRPNLMFGEADPHFIIHALKAAKYGLGWIPRIGNGTTKLQISYAGNTAWAHIKAAEALLDKKSPAGGQAFFATDNTPIINTSDFFKPFLNQRGYSVTRFYIPHFLIYLMVLFMTMVILLLRPVWQINPSNFTLRSMKQLNTTVYFSRKNAEKYIGYKPIYSYEDAFKASASYYNSINL